MDNKHEIENAKKSLTGVSIGNAFGDSFFGETDRILKKWRDYPTAVVRIKVDKMYKVRGFCWAFRANTYFLRSKKTKFFVKLPKIEYFGAKQINKILKTMYFCFGLMENFILTSIFWIFLSC